MYRSVSGFETLNEVLTKVIEITTKETRSERGTLFLNDSETGELYSRITQGDLVREIRLLNNLGIAGSVFRSGKGMIIQDAYKDARFNRSIDQQTGYVTRNVICVPIRTHAGQVIGVIQQAEQDPGKVQQGGSLVA